MPRGSRQHWTLLLTQLLTNDKKKKKKKKEDTLKTLHLPHIVMVIEEDMAEMRQLKICLTKRNGHYQSSHMLNLTDGANVYLHRLKGNGGSHKIFICG